MEAISSVRGRGLGGGVFPTSASGLFSTVNELNGYIPVFLKLLRILETLQPRRKASL